MKDKLFHIETEGALVNKKYRVFFHLLFWLVYIGSITLFFGNMISIKVVFVRTVISAIFNAALVYANLYYLMPKYFEKRKYITYLLLLHLVLLLTTVFRVFSDYAFRLLFKDSTVIGHYFLSTLHYMSVIISGYMVLMLSMSLKFIKDYFVNIDLRHRLQYQKVESELNQLKNQINPHFLFNVLGNIYSLAYMKSDIAPVMISKLSDMMRYVLYDCQAEKVPLDKEINYLQDFIALHQLRKENRMNIVFELDGKPRKLMIQPLLLLPLFENCFKHGNLEDVKNGWMKSKILITDSSLVLTIENSFVDRPQTEKKTGGIGLENIRDRLELLYPDNHSLSIHSENHVYRVQLSIVFSNSGFEQPAIK